jgi:hypothetical protein
MPTDETPSAGAKGIEEQVDAILALCKEAGSLAPLLGFIEGARLQYAREREAAVWEEAAKMIDDDYGASPPSELARRCRARAVEARRTPRATVAEQAQEIERLHRALFDLVEYVKFITESLRLDGPALVAARLALSKDVPYAPPKCYWDWAITTDVCPAHTRPIGQCPTRPEYGHTGEEA